MNDFEGLRPDVEHRAELDFCITTLSGAATNYTFDAPTRLLDASDVLEVRIFCDASLYKEVLNFLDFPAVCWSPLRRVNHEVDQRRAPRGVLEPIGYLLQFAALNVSCLNDFVALPT